jgi:hypothetical protein
VKRLLALAIVALPLVAAAQEAPAGDTGGGGPVAGMPDARQMSGRPRPDQAVPAGEVTVRVLRGELGKNAPAGTPVHLVGIAAGGKVTMLTVPVNEQGRAEFRGLATDGSVVYYALMIYDGDRLVSDAIALPPKVGVRLAMSSRKVDAAGKPIGPPIDDEKGDNGGAPPPAGEVEASVRGPSIAAGQKVLLRRAGTDETKAAELDAKGNARWTGVAGGDDRPYVVEVAAGGKTFVSTPFMLSAQAGARRMMLAYDRLLFAIQGGIQPEDRSLSVEIQLVVANVSGAPYPTGAEGLLIPLPKGFEGAQLKDDEPGGKAAIEPGEGVRFRGIVPPGQKEIVVQLSLPIDDGRASFAMDMPLGLFQSQFFVGKIGNMVVTGGKGVVPRAQRGDDGREYVMLSDLSFAPGETLRFDVAGLPMPSQGQFIARILVGLVVAALVLLGFAYAVRNPAALARTPATREEARRDLHAQRERLYAELVSLERARAARRIDPDAFAVQRRGIMTKLVLVHRQIDDLDAPGASPRPGAG